MKFENLPEFIPKSEEIESLKNFLTPYLTDDILPNQIEVEPCLKFGTLSTVISQYVSIPGSPEIKTDSFT